MMRTITTVLQLSAVLLSVTACANSGQPPQITETQKPNSDDDACSLMTRGERFACLDSKDKDSGITYVEAVLEDDGRVRSYRVIKSSGNLSMDEAVLDSMRNFSAKPPKPGMERTIVIKFFAPKEERTSPK